MLVNILGDRFLQVTRHWPLVNTLHGCLARGSSDDGHTNPAHAFDERGLESGGNCSHFHHQPSGVSGGRRPPKQCSFRLVAQRAVEGFDVGILFGLPGSMSRRVMPRSCAHVVRRDAEFQSHCRFAARSSRRTCSATGITGLREPVRSTQVRYREAHIGLSQGRQAADAAHAQSSVERCGEG